MPPLNQLEVIAMRFRRSRPALEDERCLDAYTSSGVYHQPGLAVDVWEPRFPETDRLADETENLGIFGGLVAERIARARRAGEGVLMTGGDCTHITGVLGGLQQAHGAGARIGLVWFDAHGDINTPQTTLTGSLGGMPVAVCAGLALPGWRERSGIRSPLPADRILMVDVRNLDPAEAQLIRAAGIEVAAAAPGFPGADLQTALDDLARRVDYLYFHIDSDILDQKFVPNHGTREPGGPDLNQVGRAIRMVMASGKVVAFAVVSVYGGEPGRQTSLESGKYLIRTGLQAWRAHGIPR